MRVFSFGWSSCLNACENTVLGSLRCGDRQTTLGKERKCGHVRYACTCLYLGRYYITQPHSFVGVEACTYCRECNPRNVGNICNARMSRNACIVSNVRNLCAEQGFRDGQQWKRCLDAALCSLRAIVFTNESVLVRVEQLSECMREHGAR